MPYNCVTYPTQQQHFIVKLIQSYRYKKGKIFYNIYFRLIIDYYLVIPARSSNNKNIVIVL